MLYFVNIFLKLRINVRRLFHFSTMRGEGNSVIFINREILPGPEDARISFTFLTPTKDFSEIQEIFLLIILICEILLFILLCFIFGN